MEETTPPTLAPLRSGLSLGQRLLRTGAAPDVLLQAMDEGLFEGSDLNAVVDGSPLIEHWVRKKKHASSLASLAVGAGVDPSLDWPVVTRPDHVRLALKKGWESTGAWVEHALIRLVALGVDPLLLWGKAPGNLLEWAAEQEYPWLLKACLESLSPDQRRAEATRKLMEQDEDTEEYLQLSRMHLAMKHPTPLVAQVWLENGADLHQANAAGETPIFYAASARTLTWALSQGADITNVSFSGQLPVEAWRAHVRDGEEWMAMQAVCGTSREQTLALVRSAVAKADLEALQKSYELLDDPSVTFKDGKTVLEYVAEQAMLSHDNFSRSRHKRVELNKMLRYLWTRTDLSTAKASGAGAEINGLQVAWVASMSGEKGAAHAAKNVSKKVSFEKPPLDAVVRWAHGFFTEEGDGSNQRCLNRIRVWVLDECRQNSNKTVNVDEVERVITALVDHVRLPSVSSTEGVLLINAIIPVFVEIRDTNKVSDEQASRFMALALKAMGLQARVDQGSSSTRWTEKDYQDFFNDLDRTSFVNQQPVAHLTALVFGVAALGIRPPSESVQELIEEVFSRSEVQYHPDVRPVLPVLRQEILEQSLGSQPLQSNGFKQRL